MSLIDATYFNLDINIPDSDYSDITTYITRYEKEILQKALGYELWKLVAAYNESTSPQRIKDIVEGKEYEISSGETIKWNGLKNDDKISLIAYYTYYWYVRNKSVTLHTIGMQKSTSENSANASAIQKLSIAWSRLEELYGYYMQPEYVASLFNFLSKYESDYPEWEFTELGNVNSWDL